MLDLDKIRKSKNVVDLLKDSQEGEQILSKIARSVINGYKIDEKSCEDWRKSIDESMDIAKQIMTKKSFPWEGAANIKYPLITEAAINFAARTFPEIIPNNNIVEVVMDNPDSNSPEFQRGERVSKCLSKQCILSPDWKEHIDRLLHILPVVGTVFTKTYYSDLENRNCVELCPPDQIIINYNTTSSLLCARRITHIITMSKNDIISHQRMGLFCSDIDIELLKPDDCEEDDDYEIELLEQHCYFDLDDDDYREPYIIIAHEKTNKILRIVNRIKPGTVRKNSDNEVIQLDAINYFQDYHFIRSPDGGFYSMGFGQLLLPLNKAINSLINQLVDSGTVSVTQGGFLGKGLRLKGGELRFKPFEWKVLDAAAGTDLKQNVFPFPVREPSQTLLSLLTLLINVGKELTASTDALNGTMQPTNVANSTFQGLVEQGSKILNAINKRLYDSLTHSFKKLYELNYYYLSDKEYQKIIDQPDVKVKEDFSLDDNNVRPVADPELSTINQRLQKGTMLMQLAANPSGGIDPRAVSSYILQSMQFEKEEIQLFLPPPNPNAPPPPEAIKAMAEADLAKAKSQEILLNGQIKMQQAPLDAAKVQKDMEWIDAQKQESASRIWKSMKDAGHNDQKVLITGAKMQHEEMVKQLQQKNDEMQNIVDALLREKELNIKAADSAMKHDISLEKIKQEAKDNGDINV